MAAAAGRRRYAPPPYWPRHGACGGTTPMSVSHEIRSHTPFHIEHEPVCDRCAHGASLHTLDLKTPCIGCGERVAAGGLSRPACCGFASEWFDNTRGFSRAAAVPRRA